MVGGGNNGSVIHYSRNDQKVRSLLLHYAPQRYCGSQINLFSKGESFLCWKLICIYKVDSGIA